MSRDAGYGLLAVSWFVAGMATATVLPNFADLDIIWRLGGAGGLFLLSALIHVAARDQRSATDSPEIVAEPSPSAESAQREPKSDHFRHPEPQQHATPAPAHATPPTVIEDPGIVGEVDAPRPPSSPVGGAPPTGSSRQPMAPAGDGSLRAERKEGAESGSDPESDPPDTAPAPRLREVLPLAWHNYLHFGDGHFNPDGLRTQIEALGIRTNVADGSAVNAEDAVLIVDSGQSDGTFFAVPSFMKSPGAAPNWFTDESDGALGHRTKELRKLAEGRWLSNRFEIVEKGVVA